MENIFYDAKENEIKNPQECLELLDSLHDFAQNSSNRMEWLFKINSLKLPIFIRTSKLQEVSS